MSVEQLLGLGVTNAARAPRQPAFSLLFFSDVREDISASEKYEFARSLTLFGDAQGFEAVYFPERHFHEFGAIYPDSAVMAASLIPQTRHIRFRTAGISLPLHPPHRAGRCAHPRLGGGSLQKRPPGIAALYVPDPKRR